MVSRAEPDGVEPVPLVPWNPPPPFIGVCPVCRGTCFEERREIETSFGQIVICLWCSACGGTGMNWSANNE